LVAFTVLGLATLVAGQAGGGGRGGAAANPDDWRIDPMRGPVDLGLTDPSLIGAIDVHQHLDPDAPGTGGQIRALDGFEAAILAKQRGMRGIVFKTHQDPTSAAVAYLVRKHAVPGFEMFGRMAMNYSTGGINVAAVEHFSQIKGGWGRLVEMPTRDSVTASRNMDPGISGAEQAVDALDATGHPDLRRDVKRRTTDPRNEVSHRGHGQDPNR
jgi:hypothetical protein